MHTITVKVDLDSVLLTEFFLSTNITQQYVYTSDMLNIREPKKGVCYGGPRHRDASVSGGIKRLVDPFFEVSDLSDLELDGNRVRIYLHPNPRSVRLSLDQTVAAIVKAMQWAYDDTEVVYAIMPAPKQSNQIQ